MSRYINALQAAKNRARNGKSIRMPLPGQAVQVDTLTVSLRPGRTVRHFTAIDRLVCSENQK